MSHLLDEAVEHELREYVIFGAAEAQARILTCFNNFFEQLGEHAICLPSAGPGKLTANAIAAVLMKPQVHGVAFARPQALSDCPGLTQLNEDAAAIQVLSAIRKLPDGSLAGALFDGVGLVAHLHQQGLSFTGRRVLILGAGHQSCAVALAAVKHGATHLDVLDPRQYLVQSLMSRLHGISSTALGMEARQKQYEVVINTWESNTALPQNILMNYFSKLSSEGWAVDTGLSLENSGFLKMARSLGIHTFSGIPSLRSQVRYYLEFFDELTLR